MTGIDQIYVELHFGWTIGSDYPPYVISLFATEPICGFLEQTQITQTGVQ